MSPKSPRSLAQENARLRKRVEELEGIPYPPPPAPPPKPEKRECYYLAFADHPLARNMAPFSLKRIRERMRGMDWAIAYRVADIPEDGVAVDGVSFFWADWDANPRKLKWARRKGATLKRFYPHMEEYLAATKRLHALNSQIWDEWFAVAEAADEDTLLHDQKEFQQITALMTEASSVTTAAEKKAQGQFEEGDEYEATIEEALEEVARIRERIYAD
jgi:hypothetical protein